MDGFVEGLGVYKEQSAMESDPELEGEAEKGEFESEWVPSSHPNTIRINLLKLFESNCYIIRILLYYENKSETSKLGFNFFYKYIIITRINH